MIFLENSQNSQENTCTRVSFLLKLQACNFIKKEVLAQVFSCEFCGIFKSTFFTENLWTTEKKEKKSKGVPVNSLQKMKLSSWEAAIPVCV